jgi:hypothetical protein
MQARRFLQLAPALSFLACATVDVEKIPTCEPLASLPPLPDVRSCDAQELAEYASVLRKEAIAPASRALIRVQFDETSRVGAMCVEAAVARDAWSQRRHLAERSDEIANLDPGPRCLAGKRLDLNRYEATFAEIDNAARLCAGQMGPHDECIAQHGDWIVRDRVGWTRPFLYVRPKLAEPPKLSAIETAHRCARASQGFESESECIQAEGFEMLFPPPR